MNVHVGMFVALGATFVVTGLVRIRDHRRLRHHIRRFLTGLMLAQVACLAGLAYVIWPLTPMGFAPAQTTAEAFLTHLSAGESESALALVQGGSAGDGQDRLLDPANRPVGWRLDGTNAQTRRNSGEVTLADGSAHLISIALTWDMLRARWVVLSLSYEQDTGPSVVFGLNTTTLDFALQLLPLVVGALLLLFSVVRLMRLAKERRNLVKAGRLAP